MLLYIICEKHGHDLIYIFPFWPPESVIRSAVYFWSPKCCFEHSFLVWRGLIQQIMSAVLPFIFNCFPDSCSLWCCGGAWYTSLHHLWTHLYVGSRDVFLDSFFLQVWADKRVPTDWRLLSHVIPFLLSFLISFMSFSNNLMEAKRHLLTLSISKLLYVLEFGWMSLHYVTVLFTALVFFCPIRLILPHISLITRVSKTIQGSADV